MLFDCKAYSQLLEKAVLADAYNICRGGFVLDLLGKFTSHYSHVKVNQAVVWNNGIRLLCGNPEKLLGVLGDIRLSALQDTLRRMPGAAGGTELSA